MYIRNTPEHYGLVTLALHWTTVILVVLAWGLGQGGDLLPAEGARAAGLFVHISAGLAVILLTVMRLLWRIVDPAPAAIPTPFGVLGDFAAKLGHGLLYILLVVVPVTGIIVQFARGHALPVFGIVEIASPWAADRTFARSVMGAHELLANALMVIALLHALAALLHHWLLRDRTLRRMLPGS